MDPTSRAEFPTLAYLRAAASCLASRASLLAIALLLLNDHLLKQLAPSWLTGKLSDFAGLYFTPYLLLLAVLFAVWLGQTLCGLRDPERAMLPAEVVDALATFSFVVTGVVFAALKLSPATARPTLALIEALSGTSHLIVVDPSDLLALLAIPFAYARWKRRVASDVIQASRPRERTTSMALGNRRRAGQFVVLAAATLALTATTPPATYPAVMSITRDRRAPDVLYVTEAQYGSSGSTGEDRRAVELLPKLYRSVDGGDTWHRYGQGGERVLQYPVRADSFYLVRLDSLWRWSDPLPPVPTAQDPNLQRIWPPPPGQPEGPPGRDGIGIPVDVPPWKADLVYVGDRGAVVLSEDGGSTWKSSALPGQSQEPVTALASAAAVPGRLFAAMGRQLFRSDDWGATWTSLAGMDAPPFLLKVHPANSELLLAATDAGLMRSADGGRSWTLVWPAPAPSSSVSSLLFDPEDERRVHAAVRRVGLLESVDAGQSWSERWRGHARDMTIVPPHPLLVARHLFVAAGDHGIYRQRGPVRWPWLSEWEPVNTGISGVKGFRDRVVNLASWLGLLTGLIVIARVVTPARLRTLVRDHPWEAVFAVWTLVPLVVFVDPLPALLRYGVAETLFGQSMTGAGEKLIDSWLLASLPASGAMVTLVKTRLSWITWGLMAVNVVLMGMLVLLEIAAVAGLWAVIALAVLAAGVGGSALLLRASRRRLSKALLILLSLPVYLPVWGFALLFGWWGPMFGPR